MQSFQLINLNQLQNLGFNIMDLPGATKVPGKGTVITQAALNKIPAGKTLVINTTAG